MAEKDIAVVLNEKSQDLKKMFKDIEATLEQWEVLHRGKQGRHPGGDPCHRPHKEGQEGGQGLGQAFFFYLLPDPSIREMSFSFVASEKLMSGRRWISSMYSVAWRTSFLE